MIRLSPLLLIAATLAPADTSGRRSVVDFSRFTEVSSYNSGRRPWLISPTGRSFITRTGAEVGLYECSTGKELGILKGHADKIHDGGWSANGRFLATAGYDGTVRIWDLTTLRETASIKAHDGYS